MTDEKNNEPLREYWLVMIPGCRTFAYDTEAEAREDLPKYGRMIHVQEMREND
tara:strand:- start:21356 stop:21514 length:159 start_codon:yes stop_codon:yes gene_type:complete